MPLDVRSKTAFRALLCAAWLVCPGLARAEDVPLPEVTSEGQDVPAESAAREDPTSFATTVPRRAGESATASDLVRASPGALVRDFGVNQPATVSLRGSTSDQVVVLLDGVPLNPAAGGGADLSTVPLALVDRVSVVRGAVGARYGGGAVGGVVLLETRRAAADERAFYGELGAGSFGTAEGSAGVALSLSKDVQALVSAFANTCEGNFDYPLQTRPLVAPQEVQWYKRANNKAQRAGGLLRVSWAGPVEGEVLVEADGGARGDPGTAQAPTLFAREDDVRGFGTARVAFSAGGLRFEARAGARLNRVRYQLAADDAASPQDETHVFGQLSAVKLWGRHTIEGGLVAGRESIDSAGHGAHDRGQVGAWASDEMTFSFLTVLPALRFERIGNVNGFSPKLGLEVPIGERVSVKANVGRSFRVPSFGELYLQQAGLSPNPDLRPETGTYVDAGPELHWGPVTASAAGFFALYEDLILYELYPPMRAIPENFKGARVWGGELEALVQHRYFSVSASYTLNFSENGDPRSQGKELPYRPRHRFHGRGSFNWGRFEAHVDADAQTELWQNRNNTSQLPGRVRVDVGASVILDRGLGLSLHADLRNLFESWDRDLYGYSLPGRAVYVAVRFDSSQRSTP